MSCIARSDLPISSSPSSLMLPLTCTPRSGSKPRMASEGTLLPLPDSPTMPTDSPARTTKLTPSTARTAGRLANWNVTWRSSTTRTGSVTRSPSQLRVEGFAHRFTEQVEAEGGDDDGHTREDDEMRRDAQVTLRVRQHPTPLGDAGVGRTEAEEGQRGSVDDRRRQGERRLHQHRSQRVVQDVPGDELAVLDTERLGRGDIVLLSLAQHRPAQQSSEQRDVGDRHGDDDRLVTLPDDGSDTQGQEQAWDRQHDVGEAH